MLIVKEPLVEIPEECCGSCAGSGSEGGVDQ